MKQLLVVLLFALSAATPSVAQNWVEVTPLPNRGSAAHFFNANEGVVGTGEYLLANPARIYYTLDGGKTWNLSAMPNYVGGQVTDIWFKDRKNGWATLTQASNTGWSGIYKSTDGGVSWVLVKQSNFPVTVRETAKGVFYTDRGASNSGVYASTDGGETFRLASANPAPLGIDFLDQDHGYVTSEATDGAPHLLTTDGGTTWQPYDRKMEAWTVFADVATKSFVYSAEKNSNQPYDRSAIERSVDFGGSFQTAWSGINDAITGGITGWRGCKSIMYAQGQGKAKKPAAVEGLMRSQDGGRTWVEIGGPSNLNDTRFAVTGRGAVVYAFDRTAGRVWKTLNGGDGQLDASIRDELRINSLGPPIPSVRVCDSLDIPLRFTSTTCDSVTILSAEPIEDHLGELIPLAGGVGHRAFTDAVTDTLKIRYKPREATVKTLQLRITLRQADGFIEDTVLSIRVEGLAAEERYTVGVQTAPRTIDFGAINSCTGDSSRVIEITNDGCSELRFRSLSIGGTAFELRSKATPFALDGGYSRKFLVRFRPRSLGPQNAWLVIETANGKDSIRLIGEGAPGQRGLALTQTALTSPLCDSVDGSVVLRNTSCTDVTISGSSVVSPIQILNFTAATLKPDETLTIPVRFVPTAAGGQAHTVTITATIGGQAFDTTLTINTTATGGSATLAIQDLLAFGAVSTCGELTLPIDLAGLGCGSVDIQPATLSASDQGFSITRQPINSQLASGAHDTIWVRYKPPGVGSNSITLRIQTSTGERVVTITGSGKNDEGEVVLSADRNVSAELCDEDLIGVRIANSTCDPVTIDSIVIRGANASEFLFSTQTPKTLAVGESFDASGTFKPGDAGARTAIVYVYVNDGSGVQKVLQINIGGTGMGVAPLVMSIAQDSIMEAMILNDIVFPIYSDVNGSSLVRAIEFTLALNTDLLTPYKFDLDGGILEGGSVTKFDVSIDDSVAIRVELAEPRVIGMGILGRVRARSFVADTLFTKITPIRFSAEGDAVKCLTTRIQGDGRTSASFRLIPQCGDQTLSDHLGDRLPNLSIQSMIPNPSRGDVTLQFTSNGLARDVKVSVYNTEGREISSEVISLPEGRAKHEHKLHLDAPSGQYYVRLGSAESSSTRTLLLKR